MKNSTLNRMLVAAAIVFAFTLSGCVEPTATTARKDKKEIVLEPVQFDAATVMDNKSWALSCLPSEDAAVDQACADFVSAIGGTNFTRILHADKDGAPVLGLSTWRSQADFSGCGSIDLTDAAIQFLSADGITFDPGGVTTGASYVNDQVACETKDGQAPQNFDTLKNFYSLTGLEVDGLSYKMDVGNQYEYAPNCQMAEISSTHFLSYDGINLVAVILRNDQVIESVPGACAGANPVVGTFAVTMTKQ